MKENVKLEICPLCKGTGMFEDDDGYPDTCPECNGRGSVVVEVKEEVEAETWYRLQKKS
jgi:DnaJ-class molecular chaperone